MIWHQAVRKNSHWNTRLRFYQNDLEDSIVVGTAEKNRIFYSPIEYVVHQSTQRHSRPPRHHGWDGNPDAGYE